MSKLLINQYYSNFDRAVKFGKSKNERSIRTPFLNLLNDYARKLNYEVVAEITCMGTLGRPVRPDGIVKNSFGLDIGLWESKDEKTDLYDEITAKIKKGYPLTNILFEDSSTAVLYQRGVEIMKVDMRDADKLHDILIKFISFKSDTIYKFEDALLKFKDDIPIIVETLRSRIETAGKTNQNFTQASATFLELCKVEINPDIIEADIREMMIQHILTSDIFNKIFDDPEFHRHNNIARELEKLVETLFTYSERKNLLGQIEHYYDAINSAAAGITDHHEKQKFLKVLYETFYKAYNPKAADKLGVVYTPVEIVRFQVEGVDYLLHLHFGKTLADKDVDLLDPGTGTGTYVTFMIDYIPNQYLVYKYKHEIHANEVAILPYYVANLNIEFTFKQKMGYYEEFTNLCFVDTLDNTGGLAYIGKQHTLFGLSSENTERIQRQNNKKISVVIGNPPYNANQKNENENNKNREYPFIDKRIKGTFIKHSTAQKTKVYDMYARFYRWAMDRVDKNGIISFVTNRSFIDSRTFDGFRKCIQTDFSNCYIIDTKSDVRANPKIAGTTHNVFGIQTGVAIMFLVKKENQEGNCKIEYISLDDFWRKEEKLDWLKNNPLKGIQLDSLQPDKNNNWINLVENDWEELLPLGSKNTYALKETNTIFNLYSNGIVTARDEWVYDFDDSNLKNKIEFLISEYNSFLNKWKIEIKDENIRKLKPDDLLEYSNSFVYKNNPKTKWSSRLRRDKLLKQRVAIYDHKNIKPSLYRPFIKYQLYIDYIPLDIVGQLNEIFPYKNKENKVILTSGNPHNKPFQTFSTNISYDFGTLETTEGFSLYKYHKNGDCLENISNWGLEQFTDHYSDTTITKEDIFHYVYAVLHNPAYRKKYELNLKRDFPRIPFYGDFRKWADWGKTLMDLHINYETVEPYDLEIKTHEEKAVKTKQKELFVIPKEPEEMFTAQPRVKSKLRANKETGIIEIDELTYLSGVPKEAWDYKLGNRSALEWILDQYKEKKPSDPTIAEKFNTYRFADYKDHVIDLLKRVCMVSVETMKIISFMQN